MGATTSCGVGTALPRTTRTPRVRAAVGALRSRPPGGSGVAPNTPLGSSQGYPPAVAKPQRFHRRIPEVEG